MKVVGVVPKEASDDEQSDGESRQESKGSKSNSKTKGREPKGDDDDAGSRSGHETDDSDDEDEWVDIRIKQSQEMRKWEPVVEEICVGVRKVLESCTCKIEEAKEFDTEEQKAHAIALRSVKEKCAALQAVASGTVEFEKY